MSSRWVQSNRSASISPSCPASGVVGLVLFTRSQLVLLHVSLMWRAPTICRHIQCAVQSAEWSQAILRSSWIAVQWKDNKHFLANQRVSQCCVAVSRPKNLFCTFPCFTRSWWKFREKSMPSSWFPSGQVPLACWEKNHQTSAVNSIDFFYLARCSLQGHLANFNLEKFSLISFKRMKSFKRSWWLLDYQIYGFHWGRWAGWSPPSASESLLIVWLPTRKKVKESLQEDKSFCLSAQVS